MYINHNIIYALNNSYIIGNIKEIEKKIHKHTYRIILSRSEMQIKRNETIDKLTNLEIPSPG